MIIVIVINRRVSPIQATLSLLETCNFYLDLVSSNVAKFPCYFSKISKKKRYDVQWLKMRITVVTPS